MRTSEKINIDDEALFLISRKADGSMRDAESILDQMISFGIENLTVKHIRESLGLIDQEIFFEFTDLLAEKNTASILRFSKKIFSSGHDLIDFLHGIQEHFRNLLITAALGDGKQLEVADHLKQRYEQAAKSYNDIDLIHYLHILGDSEQSVKYSFFPELTLEMLLLKMAYKPSHVQLEEILAYLEKIKSGTPELSNKKSGPNSSDTPSVKADSTVNEPVPSKKNDVPVNKNSNGMSHEKEMANFKNTLKNYQKLGEQNLSFVEKPPEAVMVDLEEIQVLWSEVINKIKTTKVALASFLEDGLPHSIEPNLLTIAFDNSNTFAQEHVEKNRKLIEKVLESDFNLPIRVKFISLDFQEMGIEQKPRTPDEVLQDLKKKEPILNDIINGFGLTKVLNREIE